MDPLTALGTVSNIISLIEFASKVVKVCGKAYSTAKDASEEYHDLKKLTTGLQQSVKRLAYQQNQPPSYCATSPFRDSNEEAVHKIAKDCEAIAQELLNHVEFLSAQDPHNFFPKARAILRNIRNGMTHHTENLSKRLDAYRSQLEFHILQSIRHEVFIQARSSDAFYQRFDQYEKQVIHSLEEGKRIFTEILASVGSLRTALKEDIKADGDETRRLIVQVMNKQQETCDNNIMETLLNSLCYKGMYRRRDEIETAHFGTCDWIFNEDPSCQFPSLKEWLRGHCSQPVFWITGKPGSGKSTLMKFVLSSSVTTNLLGQWGSDVTSEVLVVSHYFWSQGTNVQKSIVGLLRSILFQVFDQTPHLQGRLLLQSRREMGSSTAVGQDIWYSERLLIILEQFFNQTDISRGLFLALDGLDECADQLEDLIRTIQTLLRVGKGRIRILAASRPWAIFPNSLEQPDLKKVVHIHNYTYSDIAKYAHDQLHEVLRFQQLLKQDPDSGESLIVMFGDGANGVFAWVKLALRQVRKQLRRRNTSLQDMITEVQRFPKDLIEFYNHILDRIDENSHRDCAALLLLAEVRETLWDNIGHWIGMVCQATYLHVVRKEDPDNILTRLRASDSYVLINDLALVLENETGGLLEIQDPHDSQSTIRFLHLTVLEWLKQSDIQDRLQRMLSQGKQDLLAALCQTAISILSGDMSEDSHSRSENLVTVIEIFSMLKTPNPRYVQWIHDKVMRLIKEGHFVPDGLVCARYSSVIHQNVWLEGVLCILAHLVNNSEPFVRWLQQSDAWTGFDMLTMFLWACDSMTGLTLRKVTLLDQTNRQQQSMVYALEILESIEIDELNDDLDDDLNDPKCLSYVMLMGNSRVDPNFHIPGTRFSIWQSWLIFLQIRYEAGLCAANHFLTPVTAWYSDLDKRIITEAYEAFVALGAPPIQDTLMPNQSPPPDVPVLLAWEYLHPAIVRGFHDAGLYSGPELTVYEWVERRLRQKVPSSELNQEMIEKCVQDPVYIFQEIDIQTVFRVIDRNDVEYWDSDRDVEDWDSDSV